MIFKVLFNPNFFMIHDMCMNVPDLGLRKASKGLEKKLRNAVILTVILTGVIPFYFMGIDSCFDSFLLTQSCEQRKRMKTTPYFLEGFTWDGSNIIEGKKQLVYVKSFAENLHK